LFNNYTFVALIHAVSLLLYQEFNDISVMIVSAMCIIGSLFFYVVGVASLISPEITVEIDDDEYEMQSDYFGRGILQITVLIIAYLAYQLGYGLVAGILGLQATTVLVSCGLSLYVKGLIDEIEEEGDDK
jgi:hypothetical protein